MTTGYEARQAFLRNIFEKGPFQGHGFACRPELVSIIDKEGFDYTISDRPVTEWVPWVLENYMREVESAALLDDDAVPIARISTGTHIYAAAFGCEVHRFSDNNPCAVPFVRTAEEADRVEVPDIWHTPVLYRIFELARAVTDRLGSDAFIGVPDMQSGFDTASLVWNKEDMFCAMMTEDEKDAVKRLVAKCASLFKTFLIEFRKEFPHSSPDHCPGVWTPPAMAPWLSNDECGALGTDLFEEFCLPELIDLADTFGGLGMHCCADAEHQFESFKKIPNFYAFNRVASKRGYDPILEHFGGPGTPVHVLAWVSEEDTRRLIANAREGTRFIFALLGAKADDAKTWLERMRALSPRTST